MIKLINGEKVDIFDTDRACLREFILYDGITVEVENGIVMGIIVNCKDDYAKYEYLIGKNLK